MEADLFLQNHRLVEIKKMLRNQKTVKIIKENQ